MSAGGWGGGMPPDEDDEWIRPLARGSPGGPPRDVRAPPREPAADAGFRPVRPTRRYPSDEDIVYTGPQYPNELTSYGARGPDATDPRGRSGGARPAGSSRSWALPDGLPTMPTLLVAGAAVLFAFIAGHLTGGSGGTSASANRSTVVIASTTTTALPATHTVAVGENLSSIAAGFGLTTQDLANYNNINNLNHVFVGEVLKIPPSTAPTTATTATTARK